MSSRMSAESAEDLTLIRSAPLFRRQFRFEHHLSQSQHSIHGRANLMAHVGQKFALQARSFFGSLPGLLELHFLFLIREVWAFTRRRNCPIHTRASSTAAPAASKSLPIGSRRHHAGCETTFTSPWDRARIVLSAPGTVFHPSTGAGPCRSPALRSCRDQVGQVEVRSATKPPTAVS